MKLKSKIMCLFLLSTFLSVMIFLVSTYYILNNGYFSGISQADMLNITNEVSYTIDLTDDDANCKESVLKQIIKINQSYEKMQFAILMDDQWISDKKLPIIHNYEELVEKIQYGTNDYKISAKAIGQTSCYLICYVNENNYEAMTYSFNTVRSNGILGKIGLIGFVITLIITGLTFYLFSIKQMKRFENMQKILQDFALEHNDTRMEDKGTDELSVVAHNFNTMAEKIQVQYEEKIKYDQSRQALITNLSHDLRTPLSSIIGYSEMLQDEIYESKEEQKQYIDIIHRKAEYMEYLLTELMEYSSLQLGKLKLDRKKMNMTELIREIMIEYYPTIEKNGYELELELPHADIYGNWDKNRMSRVLRNLVDNALKYGMDGKKVRIYLSQTDKYLVIEIQDYGIGMKEEELKHIYDMFYRADGARNSKRGGMGLGMYIAQEIIRLHDGTIEVISSIHKGTIVRIKIGN